jgi:excisionase family DNA binding protein
MSDRAEGGPVNGQPSHPAEALVAWLRQLVRDAVREELQAQQQTTAPLEPSRLAYSLDEAAALLGLSRDTLQAECASGTLPATKIGKQWRISRHALERRLLAGTDAPAPIPVLPRRGRPPKTQLR